MSAINVNSITGRTGEHGPVLTGMTTVSDGNLVVIGTGASIGIGTSAPARALEIMGTSANAPVIRLSDTDSALSNGENAGVIEFSQNDNFDPGAVNASIKCVGDGSIGKLAFDVYAGSNRQILRIEGSRVGVNTTTISGGVNVAVGGTIRVQDSTDATQYLTINHQGINFQNTGAGSSTASSAHLLDDYEEGTFTPFISAGVTNPTLLADANGVYTKIGRAVIFTFDFSVGSGTVNGDTLAVSGLPFVSANIADNFAAGTINYNNILTGFTELRGGHISTGQISMVFYNGTGAIRGNTSGVIWSTSRRLIVSGIYQAA